jgi:hypothetical protein
MIFAISLPVRQKYIHFTEELVGGLGKTILNYKGFPEAWSEELLRNSYKTDLIVPKRKNMKE